MVKKSWLLSLVISSILGIANASAQQAASEDLAQYEQVSRGVENIDLFDQAASQVVSPAPPPSAPPVVASGQPPLPPVTLQQQLNQFDLALQGLGVIFANLNAAIQAIDGANQTGMAIAVWARIGCLQRNYNYYMQQAARPGLPVAERNRLRQIAYGYNLRAETLIFFKNSLLSNYQVIKNLVAQANAAYMQALRHLRMAQLAFAAKNYAQSANLLSIARSFYAQVIAKARAAGEPIRRAYNAIRGIQAELAAQCSG